MTDDELLTLARSVIEMAKYRHQKMPTSMLTLAHGVVRLVEAKHEQLREEYVHETVWCDAFLIMGHVGAHFEREDCIYPHFTDQATRDRMNRENP